MCMFRMPLPAISRRLLCLADHLLCLLYTGRSHEATPCWCCSTCTCWLHKSITKYCTEDHSRIFKVPKRSTKMQSAMASHIIRHSKGNAASFTYDHSILRTLLFSPVHYPTQSETLAYSTSTHPFASLLDFVQISMKGALHRHSETYVI